MYHIRVVHLGHVIIILVIVVIIVICMIINKKSVPLAGSTGLCLLFCLGDKSDMTLGGQ